MTDDRPPDDAPDEPRDDHPADDPSNDDYPADDPPARPGDGRSADDPPGSTDSRDSTDRGGGWLGNVLDALDSLERLTASGERRGDRSRLDFDVSVRTGLDDLEPRDRGDRPDRDGERRRPSGGGSSIGSIRSGGVSGRSDGPGSSDDGRDTGGRRRRKRDPGPPTDRYPVSTQRNDDELLLSADVAGVDRDDVTVGFDDGTLVVGIDGAELERAAVPWSDPEADATIKNGVLTVTVTHGGATDE